VTPKTRWYPLRDTPEQLRLIGSNARYRVVAAGRRSGKTERAKRRIVHAAVMTTVAGANFVACAPTRDQAKRIWWDDLIALAQDYPCGTRGMFVDSISYSDLSIQFINGAKLWVVGMDKPQRLEGIAIDGAALDEYAECRPEAWSQTLRPALSTIGRPGWCWFTGRPKGRGHFYELWTKAKTTEDWDSFHWPSSDILAPAEIEAAKRDLDPLTFQQEYEASFISFQGLAYYQWSPNLHMRPVTYNPTLPLVFCFDFNVDPGVAAVLQEQQFPADPLYGHGQPFAATAVIGEVHIPRNSNTPAVCNRLAQDWGKHTGPVLIYGDATGGARKTSQTEGADWDLVKTYLRPHFKDLRMMVARSNPPERERVNSMNTRLRNAAGQVRFFVDPTRCKNIIRDYEGVTLLEGGSGEIDKRASESAGLTHLSDAIGYYIHTRYPLGGATVTQTTIG